ncbi:hypothetical protein ACHMW5_13400 [Azospirillum melinis]|uniref:hypothetical protein n=1 Tax=Azospirillum melinis TaxID=328839 RepID=UPI0037575E68
MTDNKVPLNRLAGRKIWERSGLDYAVLTPENLRRLVSLIDREMKASRLMHATFRMRRKLGMHRVDGKLSHASLRCKSSYFDDREAVTFNDDGFIGFAGWADDANVVPVLTGFSKWVAELTQAAAIARTTPNA